MRFATSSPVTLGIVALAASAAWAEGPALDGMGRAMLDPLRVETLRPDDTIRRVGIRRDAVIADVGAGPGFWTVPLARAAARGRVLALDVRRDYLDVAMSRAHDAGLRNVTTRVVDAANCGLAPASVDLVWMSQLDHYLKDRDRYFAGVVRALRRRGRIVLINYEQYRDADAAAASHVGLRIVDEWRPSAAFFVLVLTSDR
jgi:ubiquinone/menaquinone biosynthesis C-methylase UbiE